MDYAWVLDTVGTNLMSVLGLTISTTRTISNDIQVRFGIEATRQCIYNELAVFDNGYVLSSFGIIMWSNDYW